MLAAFKLPTTTGASTPTIAPVSLPPLHKTFPSAQFSTRKLVIVALVKVALVTCKFVPVALLKERLSTNRFKNVAQAAKKYVVVASVIDARVENKSVVVAAVIDAKVSKDIGCSRVGY
jgi:hypothetical protein